MDYRRDIDGLRAIAVIPVILFHSGLKSVSGGYVGVDVFFVISGYLITALIYKEIKNDTFTFRNFYARRAARLIPALSLTLLFTLTFGFIFYNNRAFDNLGKELFFSSFGAVNLLYAKGVNYFANEEALRPLIHLWSLAVEEQFYIIWPVILLVVARFPKPTAIFTAFLLFLASLWLSISAVNLHLIEGYFLLQYRAFELLIGAITAFVIADHKLTQNTKLTRAAPYIGLALILLPMLFLDKNSAFPGYNALWPCVGAMLLILFPTKGLVTQLLSSKALVSMGLISYPLYLYHQPVITLLRFFQESLPPTTIFLTTVIIAIPLAWLTYRYIEKPIRYAVRTSTIAKSRRQLISLILTLPLIGAAGLAIAKSGGFEDRFKYLNPFALEISKNIALTFHQEFKPGFRVRSDDDQATALFVGDSVLQHYVVPITSAMNLPKDSVDTVTRGGCVLLKDVSFVDKFADISCNTLRQKLYSSTKKYDYVFISQSWHLKHKLVTNFPDTNDRLARWQPFLQATLDHFDKISKKIVIIGSHPNIGGTQKLQPAITSTKARFENALQHLKITNEPQLKNSKPFFNELVQPNVTVINPNDIFCLDQCITNNGIWPFFRDRLHLSAAATEYVVSHLKTLLPPTFVNN